MSDTPRTDALLHGDFRNHEGWRNHPFVELARKLERENDAMRETLAAIRGIGVVYIPPSDWDYPGQGGPPPIDAYERIDLEDIATTP